MLQITKQGNSIVVEGLNHFFYPYNGTLELPCNSVITVVDEGDIVLFRSASNYDVLFSAKIDEITINGQSVTKDNVGEVFGALSNTSSGGALTPEQEEKLNNAVQISDYNADKATQTTIDEAQTAEINKLKGDIAGKQDVIQDLNAIREGANLGKTALQEETDPVWTAEKGNYYTKTESDGIYATQVVVNEEIAARINDIRDVKATLESKADKSEIPTVPTNVSAFTNDAGYLTQHQSLDNYYTKTEVNASLETKANKSEIPSLNGYATEQWVGQQGYLTEHQPLKTINGETIVGNGDITISGGEETDPVWTAEKVNYYTKTEVNSSLEAKANKSEIPTVPTNVSAFTNDAGYLTQHQSLDNYYTKTEVNTSLEAKADKTEIPTVPTNVSAFTNDAGYLTEHQSLSNYYTKSQVDTSLESKANKTEIPTVPTNVSAFTNDAGYLTQHQSLKTINGQTIVGDGNIEISSGEETDPVWTAEKINYYTKTEVNTSLESKANKSEIPTVPTNVSAFTNDAGYLTEHQPLKTINGESIIGNGDIVISGGGEETDPVWTAEKVNYYTKSEIDGIVGNVNNALSEIINGQV